MRQPGQALSDGYGEGPRVYVVTVTFDLHGGDQSGTVYATIGADLADHGLLDKVAPELTGSRHPEQVPSNTYIGVLRGTDAKKIREDVLGAAVNTFRSHGFKGAILAVVGGADSAAGMYTVT